MKGETETTSDRCGGFFGQECSARVPFPDTECMVYFGLNSASLFTLLCAKVFVVLDSALTQIQKVLMIHMAGSSTSVLHAFSTHPYGRMVMKKKLLNVAYATLFPSSLKSSKEKVAQSSQTLKVAQSSQTLQLLYREGGCGS